MGDSKSLLGLTDSCEACTVHGWKSARAVSAYISLSHLQSLFTPTYTREALCGLVTLHLLLHMRCPNNGPASRPTEMAPHLNIASWAPPSSPRPLDTQNFGPKRIGAGAACLANSHSSREASNYALATTPAPGDLLPLHASNAPKAHEGKRESTPRASPLLPRRMHTICYGAQQSVGSANAVEGNRTSHVLASVTIARVSTSRQ